MPARAQNPSPPAPQPPPGQSRIPVLTERVSLNVTVTDRRHKFVTDLDRDDFKILEDGRPQEVTNFSRQSDLPLRIGLLLDTSNSIRPRLRFEQDAAISFLDDVIRRGKDQAFVMTFDNDPEVVQDFTDDLDLLTRAVEKQRAGGTTALHDALYVASDKLMKAPPPAGGGGEVRRVLVVISDGDDNMSDHTLSETVERADRAGAVVYSISTNTDWLAVDGEAPKNITKMHKTHGDDVLEQFADETGGRVFFPYRIDDLAQSFLDIGNELRSQYAIAYRPSNGVADGKYRKIRVELDRKGLNVRARKGYYATVPSAAAQKPSS